MDRALLKAAKGVELVQIRQPHDFIWWMGQERLLVCPVAIVKEHIQIERLCISEIVLSWAPLSYL